VESLAGREVERVDDIFGYEILVAAEKATLQKRSTAEWAR